MRGARWWLAAVVLVAACQHPVSEQEFNDLKTRVKASGEAVDAWILKAHDIIKFVEANQATICPGCGPVTGPPNPPPDGDWGS